MVCSFTCISLFAILFHTTLESSLVQSHGEQSRTPVTNKCHGDGEDLGVSKDGTEPDVSNLSHHDKRRGQGDVDVLGRKEEEESRQNSGIFHLVGLGASELLYKDVRLEEFTFLGIRLEELEDAQAQGNGQLGKEGVRDNQRGSLKRSQRRDGCLHGGLLR